MQPFFGLFNLDGWEIVLILALILILFGTNKLPELAKGLWQGIFEFRRRIDEDSSEAGRSLGGIYGKPAAEALTPDNQVAELYDPDILYKQLPPQKRRNVLLKLLLKLRRIIRRFVRLNRPLTLMF